MMSNQEKSKSGVRIVKADPSMIASNEVDTRTIFLANIDRKSQEGKKGQINIQRVNAIFPGNHYIDFNFQEI